MVHQNLGFLLSLHYPVTRSFEFFCCCCWQQCRSCNSIEDTLFCGLLHLVSLFTQLLVVCLSRSLVSEVISSSEAPVTPTFSFPVACFYRDDECFLFVFFSLVIFPEGVEHISEVPVTHTFSFVSPISIAKASAFP